MRDVQEAEECNMKSKPSKIGVLLLLSILVISLPQMMNLNVAKASNAAVTYCPNYLEEEDGENDRSIGSL